ncbi:1966_t:CDS:1 [Gigaspora margarita]|uniref:1966_t:CDS:1 n=1 Tax=Gigaspora margarita TaxID=4874 RepID=A0ABN7UFG7_GIGMA|nr:1966_t:CDS:1 [Gigaspora margarita]
METDQIHSYINKHDSLSSTRIFGLDEQNAKVYSVLSREIRALDKKLDDYYSEYNSLKKMVKRLEREIENLDKCVDRDTIVDLIYEIVFLSLINKRKGKDSSYLSDSAEESESVEIIEIRKRKAIPYKQRRKA